MRDISQRHTYTLRTAAQSHGAAWDVVLKHDSGATEIFDGFPDRANAQRWMESETVKKWLGVRFGADLASIRENANTSSDAIAIMSKS